MGAARAGAARAIRAVLLATLGGMAISCASAPDGSARVALVAPDSALFSHVAAFADHRCGSLDCHGQVGRNWRLYGNEGLRLNPTDVPGGRATTTDEVASDYLSTVGLEPEVMAAVVADGGADPERLTLVRKGRGTEHHKGGALIVPGDAQDRCLTSWLASALDTAACDAAAMQTP